MKKKSIWILLLLMNFLCIRGQLVTDVSAYQSGKEIVIMYNLDKQTDISVSVSTDGGKIYLLLRSVRGDVGRNVSPGVKRVTWDVLSDREKFVYDNVVFKVDGGPIHEAVDLGLSVKWATCNVGATKPEEYGYYYAWGSTFASGYYTWATYKYSASNYGDNMTKYNTGRGWGHGKVDNKKNLDLDDDVAHVAWGGNWRMPTLDEIKELVDKCKWTWAKRKSVKGYVVQGPSGNSIFLPAAGYRNGKHLENAGAIGNYWSSELSESDQIFAWFLKFSSGTKYRDDSFRCCGRSVRAVCE